MEEKPFWDHFDELRARLLKCVYFFVGAACVGYLARDPIMLFLKEPLFQVLPPEQQHLYFTGLLESFMNSLRVAMIAGLFLALPFIFYQVWAFVAPGLHAHERRLAIPFVVAATLFFVAGAAFAHYFVFPQGFKFFVEFGEPAGDLPMLTIKEYFGLIFRLYLVFGLSFEFPVILVFLARLGIINSSGLREQRRAVMIGITVLCAVAAPPDVLSMLFMMVPLIVFFEMAVLLIRWMEKNKASQGKG